MNGDKVKSAAIAGVGIGVVSAIPILNYCCVLWGAGGGALAVRLYTKTGGGRAVTPGEGAGLGAMTGAVAATVFFALSAPLTILLTPEETFEELMRMTGQEAPIGRVPLLLLASAVSAVVVFVATTIGGL